MPTYFPAKEIVSNLWIGSEGDATDPGFFRDHNIGYVVNCTRNIATMPGVETYRIPVDDALNENARMLSHWPVVVRDIDAALSRGKGVLVHCRAGMQRSAATVAAYLMYKYNLTSAQAKDAIQKRKPETFFPTPTFEKALRNFEAILKKERYNNSAFGY